MREVIVAATRYLSGSSSNPFGVVRSTFRVVLILLLFLSASSNLFAGSATWNSSSSTDWNTNANWMPATGYPGTTAGDTATFSNSSSVTSLFISSWTFANALNGITFTALETHGFTITIDANVELTISGTGITNNSGITQNFVLAPTTSGSGTRQKRFLASTQLRNCQTSLDKRAM